MYRVRSPRAFLSTLTALLIATGAQSAVAQSEPQPPALPSNEVRVGDRIVLTVNDEPTLSDTFTVASGPEVHLPGVGVVSLVGVTRADITAHLTTAIARTIREPVVRAQLLLRLAVLGEVARPGFFTLPFDALLSDAISEAGGVTSTADMRKVRVSRRGEVLLDGDAVRDALAAGHTLDALDIAAGDQMLIPRGRDAERTVRILGLLVAIPLTAFALTRM